MAEAMDLFSSPDPERKQNGKGTAVPDEVSESLATMAQASLPPKTREEDCPPKYALDNYYQDDEIAKDVLRNKYLAPWEKNPWDLWVRQAKAIASVEKTEALREEWEAKFLSILEDFRFVPGGRIMHGAGRDDIKTTLNNCYVVAIKEDAITAIYQAVIDEALTFKYGGGCGHDLSGLRPSGSPINGTGGESCGPTGFMDLFSTNTNTIAQHGRRGANMQTLRVDHPDIEKFITIKRDLNKVKYSNISVLLTHEFMRAVEEDRAFDLRWDGQVYQTVQARDLWHRIISAAHVSAEPGLLFWDTMIDYHNGEYCSPLVSTNPCAEQPLPDGGCCNLGSINLERFVDDNGQFMLAEFKETVGIATRFLDNVIDYNLDRHALPIQKENATKDRRIGLGILGLGDMLVRMRTKYDSDDALAAVEEIMQSMCSTAYATSSALASEKGPYPNFDWQGYKKSKFVQNLSETVRRDIIDQGIRNVTILTVPPTGSGAIVAQVTSGIEPIFATSYKRRVKQNEGYGDTFKEYTIYHPIIKNLFGNDKDLPEYVVTAHNIDPYFRVKMQGVIQRFVDSSISSTVNLPEDIDVETVADIYMTAYHEGLKGITVYREGSREGILISEDQTEKQSDLRARSAGNGSPEDSTQGDISTEQTEALPGTVDPAEQTSGHDPVLRDKPHLHPRSRPAITHGLTRRVRTGEGNLYITINEDERGLCEVFTTIGKAGGVASTQAEAISRLISLALRSGVDAREIVKQLKGISGPSPTWENGRLVLSTPDAIGQALDDYLDQRPQHQWEIVDNDAALLKNPRPEPSNPPPADSHITETTTKSMTTCPRCGGTVVHESGCVTCHGCGFSRC
ncbi:MAG: adenosylcobalamin-dependent ribonucleoside-diphosphate reductase [Fidelibacterota bacterium]|nr:MAG: adenosylcobalamin-dependent ribonucleoside-diphosphate reductase [Candidatus Neomarinimicrobiota bacterium]